MESGALLLGFPDSVTSHSNGSFICLSLEESDFVFIYLFAVPGTISGPE